MRTVRIYQRTDAERMIRLDREEILDYAKKVYGTIPEYLMDQNNWISVLLDGTVGETKILDSLDRSYLLAFAGLLCINVL